MLAFGVQGLWFVFVTRRSISNQEPTIHSYCHHIFTKHPKPVGRSVSSLIFGASSRCLRCGETRNRNVLSNFTLFSGNSCRTFAAQQQPPTGQPTCTPTFLLHNEEDPESPAGKDHLYVRVINQDQITAATTRHAGTGQGNRSSHLHSS